MLRVFVKTHEELMIDKSHVLSRARKYALCVRVCARIFKKDLFVVYYYLMSLDSNIHKDVRFLVDTFAK